MTLPENETLRGLRARKSVRVFTEEPVSPEMTAALFDAAVQAPTAGAQQLYTIIYVTDAQKKAALADLCDHQPFIEKAPLVLVFVADCRKWYEAYRATGCAPRAPGAGDLLLACADAIIAAQNMVVAAHSLALGSCYIGDVLENCADMRALLALPKYCVPAAMLVIGHPTQQQLERKKPARFPVESVVCENVYSHQEPEDFATAWIAREHTAFAAEEYTAKLRAFCARKYNSDFAREMTRSAEEYLAQFAWKQK